MPLADQADATLLPKIKKSRGKSEPNTTKTATLLREITKRVQKNMEK